MSVTSPQSSEKSFDITDSSKQTGEVEVVGEELEKAARKARRKRNRESMLTDDQKKKHHIESEHKRRQAIRDAFEKLVEIVPELTPNDSRSEIVVLNKSSAYLKQLYEDYRNLIHQAKQGGFQVKDELVVSIPNYKTSE